MKLFRSVLLALSLRIACAGPLASLNSVAKLRGGAGPLDPTLVAKVGMAVQAAQGAYGMLAPSKNTQMYGGKTSATMDDLMEGMAAAIFRCALMGYLSIIKGEPVHRVIGIGAIPHFVMQLKLFLNDRAANQSGLLLDLGIVAFTIYSCLAGTDYAETAAYTYLVWGLLNGIGLFFFTDKLAEMWGIEGDDMVLFGVKGVGHTALNVCALMLPLLKGESALKAYGYAWALTALGCAYYTFVTKEIDDLGLNKKPIYFYIVLGSVIAGTLLL